MISNIYNTSIVARTVTILAFAFGITVISCCHSDGKNSSTMVPEKAIALNDSAMSLYNDMTFGLIDTSYSSVVRLLDEAILVDSTYRLAHLNKASVLQNCGQGEAATRILVNWLATNPGDAHARTFLGIIYEANGRKILARKQWNRALVDYNQKARRFPDSVGIFLDRSMVKALLGRQDEAVADMDSLRTMYPNSDWVQKAYDGAIRFNKDDMIDGYRGK